MRTSRRTAFTLLLCTCLLATGCLTRHVREDVYKERRVDVFLRLDKKPFTVVEKGYDHPATVSAIRVAHILSRIDVRKSPNEGGKRVPAIPTVLLYSIADGVSKALAKANEDQEVVVMALRKERFLKLLDKDHLTSFVAYVRGDQLFLHLSHLDWPIPDRVTRQAGGLPQPRVGDHPMRFKVYSGTAMTLLDNQSVAVAWRDPIFKRPTRTKIMPSGEVKRKTILLESPEELPVDDEPAGQTALPSGLSSRQLRALAELEAERESGRITEAEYRLRQNDILNRN